MNLRRCGALRLAPVTGTFFRAIPPKFHKTALRTSYTKRTRSRFSPGRDAAIPYEILYLSENASIALHEVEAQYRDSNGRIISNPRESLLVMNVDVTLGHVADLTDVSQQKIIGTNAQELTGDWRWYSKRQPSSSVPRPVGLAPTQELGQALYSVPSIEGFVTVSPRMPDQKNLVVFPKKLQAGSNLKFIDPIDVKPVVVKG